MDDSYRPPDGSGSGFIPGRSPPLIISASMDELERPLRARRAEGRRGAAGNWKRASGLRGASEPGRRARRQVAGPRATSQTWRNATRSAWIITPAFPASCRGKGERCLAPLGTSSMATLPSTQSPGRKTI